MKPDPFQTIKKLINERYKDAKAVFWAGSVSKNQGNDASDLDLIIVFEAVPQAYREAFIYDGWPIDAFIQDTSTLRYFLEDSRVGNGISGLIHMILHGRLVTEPNAFSENILTITNTIFDAGPAMWDRDQINKERFLITDVLDDVIHPASRAEQMASASWLLEAVGQFYFRSQNKWCASGKSIIRYLENDNPILAAEFTHSFEQLFQTGNTKPLAEMVKNILQPFGGLFWDGFNSKAPKSAKIHESGAFENQIETLERLLLDATDTQLNQLISDDFIEFSKSGKVYNKQDCIQANTVKKSVITDFKVAELSKDVMLATYQSTEDTVVCLRSSIWKRYVDDWKILFHQGTKISS